MFTECGLSDSRVDVKFHARGPATQKALSLRHRVVQGTLKSLRELERKRASEQHTL